MRFIGIDLAWSYRNPTAAVALENGVPMRWEDELKSDKEIVQFVVEAASEGPALVAIDAPLVVPNESGTRPCDREVSRAYRREEAGTYPANRRRLGPHIRGEELVAQLLDMGFTHSLAVAKQAKVRQVVEVYPHPGMVELFGLERTLKYKARLGRSYQDRWRELSCYMELLRNLTEALPRLRAEAFLSQLRPQGRRGQALKRLEDLLDALFCAYIAFHLWYWGKAGYRCFGDMASGYILVPIRVRAETPTG